MITGTGDGGMDGAGTAGFVGELEELSGGGPEPQDPLSPRPARPTRRQLLLGGGTLLAGGGAWALSRRAGGSSPTPQEQGASWHTGPEPLWTHRDSGQLSNSRFGQDLPVPLFLSGTRMASLDPATGAVRSSFQVPGSGALVFGAGLVFTGSGGAAGGAVSGVVTGYALASGRGDWQFAAPPPADDGTVGRRVSVVQPQACDGTVLYCSSEEVAANGTSTLLAVSVQTRQLLWSRPQTLDGWLAGVSTAPGGLLLGREGQSRLVALSAADGHRLWATAPSEHLDWRATDDQHVYLPRGGTGVQALSLLDGTARWGLGPRARDSWRYLQPVAGGGVVYLFTDSGLVSAHEAQDGRQLWAFSLPFPLDARSRPLLAGDTLIIPGPAEGGVVALDASGGSMRWTFQDGTPGVDVWTVGTDGTRVFAGRDAFLHALPLR